MKRFVWFVVLALLALCGCISQPGAKENATRPDESVRLFYSANRQGEIDPCGCQVNQVGGLDRLKNFFVQQREGVKKASLFVDAGDSFFASTSLLPSRREKELLKAKTIAKAYGELGLTAFTPGDRDFAGGVPLLRELEHESRAVFVASNLEEENGGFVFEPYTVWQAGEFRLGILGVVSPDSINPKEGLKVSDPLASLRLQMKKLKGMGISQFLVLSHLGLTADRELAKQLADSGLMGIVGAHSLDVLNEPAREGEIWLAQTQIQGQQVGVIDFNSSNAKKIAHAMVDLDKTFEKENSISALIAQYNEAVRELAVRSETKPVAATKARPYVANPQSCRTCHTKQYDFWAQTKHASAMMVLYSKNQHFDGECIGCHSLGFEQPGGFSKITDVILTNKKQKKAPPLVETILASVFEGEKREGLDSRKDPERYQKLHAKYLQRIHQIEESGAIKKNFAGVQCEHCHGNRQGHPGESVVTQKAVVEASCRNCHRPPNAPEFSSDMMAKVACPLSSR